MLLLLRCRGEGGQAHPALRLYPFDLQIGGFPPVSGIMKALRLPVCASPVAYLFRFRGPRDPPLFVLALAALPDGWRTHPGQGIWSAGHPVAGTLSSGRRRDLTGSQAIHSMPLPRSKTPAGPTIPHPDGVVDAAPAQPTAKAPAIIISRLLTRLRHLLPTLRDGRRRTPCKAGWLTFTGRELNPLDRDERFQNFMFILLS